MQISLSEYIGAKTTPTTYRLVGWRLLRVYAAAREVAIVRARKGRQRRGSWLRRRGIDAVNSPGCGDGYRSAGCQIAAEKHRWHPVPSCGGCAASRVSGARPGDSCRSKEQCADCSTALNGASARRAVNPARRPLYLPIGTYLVVLEARRGDPRDRGYMNDFYSRTTGNGSEFARDTDSVLPDAVAMSDAEAVVAASVLLGLAFLILT